MIKKPSQDHGVPHFVASKLEHVKDVEALSNSLLSPPPFLQGKTKTMNNGRKGPLLFAIPFRFCLEIPFVNCVKTREKIAVSACEHRRRLFSSLGSDVIVKDSTEASECGSFR